MTPQAPPPRVDPPAGAVLRVELGRRWLAGDQVDALRSGSLLPLAARADEPVEVRVNGRLVAKGTPVVVDGKFAVSVDEIVPAEA